jgi:hypothetical protein
MSPHRRPPAIDEKRRSSSKRWPSHTNPIDLWYTTLIIRWIFCFALYQLRGCTLFAVIFVFRYLRLVGNLFSFWFLYRATPTPTNPTMHRSDCSVIIPTVDPTNEHFDECVQSILRNAPKQLIMVTVGHFKLDVLERLAEPLRAVFTKTQIICGAIEKPNKRRQVAHAFQLITGSVAVLVDDHVFWPSDNFLPAALAPLEDPTVGMVGTWKRVRRDTSLPLFSYASIVNMLTCTYLMRHNFELCASNAIDTGVFVVSGRTALIRAAIVQNAEFVRAYANETFLLGLCGPLNADDDNFITRWLVSHDWAIKFQACPDAVIETVIGADSTKFHGQCLRWARTTWRSNTALLWRRPRVWVLQPWCAYAVYIAGLTNFALLWDGLLVWSATRTQWYAQSPIKTLAILVAIIFLSKTVKLWGHWRNEPRDFLLFPANVLFAYYHSFIKFMALVTFWDNRWGGRDLSKAVDADVPDEWEIAMPLSPVNKAVNEAAKIEMEDDEYTALLPKGCGVASH